MNVDESIFICKIDLANAPRWKNKWKSAKPQTFLDLSEAEQATRIEKKVHFLST